MTELGGTQQTASASPRKSAKTLWWSLEFTTDKPVLETVLEQRDPLQPGTSLPWGPSLSHLQEDQRARGQKLREAGARRFGCTGRVSFQAPSQVHPQGSDWSVKGGLVSLPCGWAWQCPSSSGKGGFLRQQTLSSKTQTVQDKWGQVCHHGCRAPSLCRGASEMGESVPVLASPAFCLLTLGFWSLSCTLIPWELLKTPPGWPTQRI